MDRERYHPIPIGADLLRYNNFEFIAGGSRSPIQLMCKIFNLTLPKTNPVPVPWASGTMSLAGRTTGAYSFTITCLVGLDSQYNAWEELYKWRTQVFDHDTGRISLANEYKKTATMLIYDITAETVRATTDMEGVWPSDVSELAFSVETDTPVEVTATFFADKIYMSSF